MKEVNEDRLKHVQTKITRRYYITQKQLKRKLGLIGNISEMGLWRGLSPKEEEEKRSHQDTVWYIDTVEGKMDEREDS